jgi:predicted helicase
MSALATLLDDYRVRARTEREKGTYFEELIQAYMRHEPMYRERYSEVLTFAEWAKREKKDARDAGIDLVAIEKGSGDVHAIQCKLYDPNYRIQKSDIDSFFTRSGQRPFVHRLLVATTNRWTEHAEAALIDQQPAVTKIDLHALENSALDWARFRPGREPKLHAQKKLLPHQRTAVEAVCAGLAKAERGKLIMACGTGKTFTSLKIAEALAGEGKRVLFLVPSLALLSQTLTEWTHESATPLRSFAVCSDSEVGKKPNKGDVDVQTLVHELQYPATTNAKRLATELSSRGGKSYMTVVFGTYHSIDVIGESQREHNLPPFDLIVCDEAHRTTGAKFEGEGESHFVKVHDDEVVRGKKRLYMTATPRLYGEAAKIKANANSVTLCSMDDPKLYGEALYTLPFSEAVRRGLLVDYKVVVLSIEESHISRRIQELLKDEESQLKVDDAARIVGCWKALSKQGLVLSDDAAPMRRAVAFCQVIERSSNAKVHKISSKLISSMFQKVIDAYRVSADEHESSVTLRCEARHVDGSMNATEKGDHLEWLKDNSEEDVCRILTNVRCLSEGVDVPALDAVLFLAPRNSQVDVVQSVGRVMRKAEGKTRGYVILPVVIPAGVEPHEALNDNQTYRVVWQVLQALRSHDDRFDAMINKLEFTGADPQMMEVIAVTDKYARRAARKKTDGPRGDVIAQPPKPPTRPGTGESQFPLIYATGEIESAIYAKLVQKVGNRYHWEEWANDIAKIARTHADRIQAILDNSRNKKEREIFGQFANELRDDLNGSLDNAEIVEMLAQHLITKPVFDALFADYSFASQNPMSKAMQSVIDVLQAHRIDKEADTLSGFYESVKQRASGIESAEGRQKIVVELYDKFFRNAFPKMTQRLGIVYTPVEIVDFVIRSVDELLQSEFGQTLGSKGVHIIDPFVGTGTFITRLLQSGLIQPDELPRKYKSEIHANEIVLLAYYIAAINIESAYHGIVGGEYQPFEGICLTDTFQMYEKDDLVDLMLEQNSTRRKRQRKLDIRVIIGNPPYSVGQKSENDNNQNVDYPQLDARLRETYAARSDATNRNSLYDSYIRAIRWASDRVGESGIVGFVTNANFVEATTADGLRKCLAEEFSSLYVFHLRGNARTSGERRRQEKDNVFGMGSRAPVAISLLVKNPAAHERGRINFRDIGDYLPREEKLAIIAQFGSVSGITDVDGWTRLMPDGHGDWLKQRDESLEQHLSLGDKSGAESALFASYSGGIKTQRDAWAYGPSKRAVAKQMSQMIAFYNAEAERFEAAHEGQTRKLRETKVDDFVVTDSSKIAWTSSLKAALLRGSRFSFDATCLVPSVYRPYTKQWLYFSRRFNERVYQMPRIFPGPGARNRVIGVSASESRGGYSVLMTDVVPSLHCADMVGSQYFPLYIYDVADDVDEDEDGNSSAQTKLHGATKQPELPVRRDAITDAGLAHFQSAWPGEKLTREDVFYYVYGILHSPDYRERYAANLGKELPRIPPVKKAADFWAFSRAGRVLAELHVGYERVDEYPARIETGSIKTLTSKQYRVEKRMRFGKQGSDKTQTVIHYNDFITVHGIPLEAYNYVVNGQSAIEWVMERQSVSIDKDSGIVKDANDWATETMSDPRYPLSLLLRVITVSTETVRLVAGLPKLDVREVLDLPKVRLYESAAGQPKAVG